MKIISPIAILVCAVELFLASQPLAAATVSSTRLEIVADKLYLAGIGHGFHVLDISDPIHPKWIGGWRNHTCPVGVQVVDGLAYLANRTSGLDVIDVRNPAAPAQVGHLSTGGDLQTIQVLGQYAYVADLSRGLDIIDISEPKQPKLAGDFETKGQAWSAVVNGDYAYTSFGGGTLRTFHLENGSNPKPVGECKFAGGQALQVVDGTLFSGCFGSLYSVEIGEASGATIITNSSAHMNCQSLCIEGRLAFVTGPGIGLSIFDVGNPKKIQQLGILEVGYQGYGVRVAGNYAYVTDGGANLHVIDFSDPTKPVEVNRIGTENFCSRVVSLADFAAEKSTDTAETVGQGPVTNAPPQITEDSPRVSDDTPRDIVVTLGLSIDS